MRSLTQLSTFQSFHQLYRLTFWSRFSKLPRESMQWDDRVEKTEHVTGERALAERGRKVLTRQSCACLALCVSITGNHRNIDILYKLCCVTKQDEEASKNKPSLNDLDIINRSVKMIKERRKWKTFCNAAAVVALSTACFIWGYFA